MVADALIGSLPLRRRFSDWLREGLTQVLNQIRWIFQANGDTDCAGLDACGAQFCR
jgi:hypothetical protein